MNGAWSPNIYEAQSQYNLAGGVTLQIYPSSHQVNYLYDGAGRTSSFTGNLGEGGASRNYATEILYSASGAMTKEKFGTATPLYNKLLYNSRGQLAEIRESTSYSGPSDTDFNRGAIINDYSNNYGCWGASCNAPDNNGNLMKQSIYIPTDDQGNYTMSWQQYEYDSLNRLRWAREINGSSEVWRQTFVYDRYGNRTISTDVDKTYGGVNNLGFELNTAKNRLYAPGDLAITDEAQRRMQYDAAGNLKRDTYTGAGDRNYDAENRMTKAWGGNNQWQEYTYNADGQRVRRKIDGVETWQVYGISGIAG
ncbi:MAG TPA: hypothetical protein VGO68_22340 [Pyrinomonadaceae bacterium]|nr:hypothetical protein [Pyrinomonadaceae bacterium]